MTGAERSEHSPLVVVTPYGRAGGSSRVRVYHWLDHLGIAAEAHAYRGASSNRPGTVVRHPLSTVTAEVRTRALRAGGRSLLISREASPFSSGRLEARLLRSAEHGVYDVDDALFHDSRSGLRGLVGTKARTWERAVRATDVVVAGNDYLAEHASRSARRVVVIPSCVEPDAYRAKTSYALGSVPRIVWVGSPSTEQYLLAIASSLLEVHRRTGARLRVVSAAARGLGALDGMVDRVDWRPGTVAGELAAADVAIGPLADTPFARGKCAYKLLQYAAAGLPTVASPVGANRTALDVLGGFAATSADEWVDALTQVLTCSAADREQLGRQARGGVVEHYSFARWADEWTAAVQP